MTIIKLIISLSFFLLISWFNAINQVKAFKEETEVTGLVLTKLDGTAKGGVVVGIVEENKIPVKFIGVGEQIDDMEIFNSKDFSKAII